MDAPKFRKGTLAAIVGSLAAATLLTITPQDESGRKVAASVAPDGVATVTHVSGPQYLRAYLDIAGVPTACDGITAGVRMGQVYTEAQCGALLERELTRHAEGVMRCSPALRQAGRDWQRVAAVTHAYQFGIAAWCTSTAHDLIEAARIEDGCDVLPAWNKARRGGVLRFSAGVQRRSQRRREYCRTGLDGAPVETLQARLARWN
jgi:lysozyme